MQRNTAEEALPRYTRSRCCCQVSVLLACACFGARVLLIAVSMCPNAYTRHHDQPNFFLPPRCADDAAVERHGRDRAPPAPHLQRPQGPASAAPPPFLNRRGPHAQNWSVSRLPHPDAHKVRLGSQGASTVHCTRASYGDVLAARAILSFSSWNHSRPFVFSPDCRLCFKP